MKRNVANILAMSQMLSYIEQSAHYSERIPTNKTSTPNNKKKKRKRKIAKQSRRRNR